jgi:hypothetical protein
MKTSAQHILMVRPANFGFNLETADSNVFQNKAKDNTWKQKALQEFDSAVEELKKKGIEVYVFQDDKETIKPDAIFPNNWFSTHADSTIVTYLMLAPNRRLERKEEVFSLLEEKGHQINDVFDLSLAETEGYYLEGTGSIILDRDNELAYCCISERSDEELFIEFCEEMQYFPVIFTANHKGIPIYHTNVVLSITSDFAVVCLDSISSKSEKKELISHFKRTGKEIISISTNQMEAFCGNCLEVRNDKNEKFLVCSETAKKAFSKDQVSIIEKTHRFITCSIPTIEKIGGGSIRCMIAEVFLPIH